MVVELTKGKPLKQILLFTLPVLLGGIFQQLYAFADTLIVGRTISLDALAAVGTTGSLTFLMQGFAMGVTSGFSVFTAQRFGAGDEAAVRKSIAVTILFSAGLSVFMTALSLATAKPMLRLLQVPDEIFDQAYEYLFVIYAGFASLIFYNMYAQLLRSLGDSRTPLFFFDSHVRRERRA